MAQAPIVLFVYNRPEHTRRTVEGLLTNPESSESPLHIFADGPKPSATQKDLSKIYEVRDYIHSIRGFKKIYITEQEENKGLAPSTIMGMNQIFSIYDKAIMMEDDDVPTPFFLNYVNECLNRFANNERIWCISGYTDTSLLTPRGQDDLFLVHRPSSWGFGTWKRCWEKVIWDKEVLKGLISHKDVILGYNKWCGLDSSKGIVNCIKDVTSSWSIRFNFSAYLTRSYTILPTKSLIWNIGLDGTGTHSPVLSQNLEVFDRRIRIPSELHFDPIRNHQLMMSFVPHGLKSRLKYHLGLFTRFEILQGLYHFDDWGK